MTLAAQILTDVDDVFLQTDDFAKTITRYVGGDEANTLQITGIVVVQSVSIQDSRGRGFVQAAEMHLSSDTTIHEGDGIKYENERYEVKTIGATEHGMRLVSLVKYKPEVKGGKLFRNGDI